ncbi:MAG: transposase [Clostridia bacterium]
MELPSRKNIRLENYDYGQNGAYFVTICTYKGIHNLSVIERTNNVGQGLCSCRLTTVGRIVQTEIENLNTRFPNINIDNYVIMPNHIHLILSIVEERQEQSPCPTMCDVICALKSLSTKSANNKLMHVI